MLAGHPIRAIGAIEPRKSGNIDDAFELTPVTAAKPTSGNCTAPVLVELAVDWGSDEDDPHSLLRTCTQQAMLSLMTAARSGARSRGTRAPRGAISRDQIVEAALRLLASGSYDQLTVRALARELDVAPMSLYRHIESKDAVLDEAVDILLGAIPPPRVSERDWQRYLTAAAVSFRDFLVSQPAALHVYLRHPVVSPAAIDRMNAMLHSLRLAGCSERDAERAYATIHTYTIGFAALEANREKYVLPPSDSALESQLATFTTARQFRDGLTYVLTGIEAKIRVHTAK